MHTTTRASIVIEGREIKYDLRPSKSAKKLRMRVGLDGVAVVLPQGRDADEVPQFMEAESAWLLSQIDRVEQFRNLRRPVVSQTQRIMYRGKETSVQIVVDGQLIGNVVNHDPEVGITIRRGMNSNVLPVRSLENWLRRQARVEFTRVMGEYVGKVGRAPEKVYVMGQRTKWGNCSARRNISLNWRLILAPEGVLRYIVAHEVVHLAVPDHSAKFWLTLQSLCPETERAKQWLSAHGLELRHALDHFPQATREP